VSDAHLSFFLSMCFLCAFTVGSIVVISRTVLYKERISWRSIAGGIILGIPNYFSIYGVTRALGSNVVPSAALYPINNIGMVLLAAISAMLLFGEKLSRVNWIGLAMAVAAIALMAI
jgi:drug/metabolite transporter (DMT)-like permease